MKTYWDRLYCEMCGEEFTNKWERVGDTSYMCPNCTTVNIHPGDAYILQYGTNPEIIRMRNKRKYENRKIQNK